MVQLKPEIYKMIVESMLATEAPFDHNTKLDQQQSLARMMQASKVSAYPLHAVGAVERGPRELGHRWEVIVEIPRAQS